MSKSTKKITFSISDSAMTVIEMEMNNIRFYCRKCNISCCYTPEYSLIILKGTSCPKCNGRLVASEIPKQFLQK